MKLIAMESEVWWLVRPDDIRPVKGLSIYDIIKKIQEKFNFAAVPKELPGPNQGLTFREGVLRIGEKTIVVKALEVYNDGVHLSVDSSTDDTDEVFSRLRNITIELGGKPVYKPLLHYHVSTIVCEFEYDISQIIRSLSLVSVLISSHLDIPAEVGLRGLYFAADPTVPPRVGKISTSNFKLEPRLDATFSEKRYFSVANMTTENHITVLTSLDRDWSSVT